MRLHTKKRATRTALAAASALCVASVLAACGSDDDSGDSGSEAEGGGDPIKVMVYGPFDAKGFSLPDVQAGAEAGIAKVNEDGGVGGRDLELIACNDNNDPNTAAGCARQAVQEKVVAVIGGFSTFEPQIVPVLEKAGIPMIAVTPVSTFAASNIFPVTGGAPGSLFSLGKSLAENPVCEGKVAGVIEQFAATEQAIQLPALAVQASGAQWTGVSGAPQGATDFAPAVAAAAGQAPCIIHLAGPQTSPIIIQAIAANGNVKAYGASESTVPSAAIEALGAAAEGSLAFSSYQPLNDTTDTPEMKEFLERGREIREEFSPDSTAASSYLGPQILQKALEGEDTEGLTAEDVTAAIKKLKGFDTGLGPIVDFTVKNPTKAFSSLPYDSPVYQWIAKGGEYVIGEPESVKISAIYDAAAKAGR